jgi:hypothetical protein
MTAAVMKTISAAAFVMSVIASFVQVFDHATYLIGLSIYMYLRSREADQ